MATIDLGKIKQVWRGTYNNGTAYTVDDLVAYTDTVGGLQNTSTYICVTNSTGNAPASAGTVHGSWNLIAQGVPDRVPSQSGQSGKYLTTNGSTLSFGTISQDWVRLSSSGSGSGTNVGWNGHYTSDYQCYKVMMKGLYKGNTGNVRFRFYNSGGSGLTGAYTGHANDSGNASDDNYYNPQTLRTANSDNVLISDAFSTSGNYLSYIEWTIWDPLSSVYPRCNFRTDIWDGSSWTEQGIGTIGYRGGATTTGGAFIYCENGNTIYYNDIIVFGLRT